MIIALIVIGAAALVGGLYFVTNNYLKKSPLKTSFFLATPSVKPIATARPGQKIKLPILLYHHIAMRTPQDPYYVSPEIFEQQMDWLKTNGYNVVSMKEALEFLQGKIQLPEQAVVITFDDGDADQYQNAFPILKKYNFPATFFIKLNSYNTEAGITTRRLLEMKAAGMDIQSHSVNHDSLAQLNDEELKKELVESKTRLEQDLGAVIDQLSYPGGAYDERVIQAAQAAGYKSAVTTRHSIYQDPQNLFILNRSHIDDDLENLILRVEDKVP